MSSSYVGRSVNGVREITITNDTTKTFKLKIENDSYQIVSALVDESPKKIGELPDGEWVCSVIYPINLDITVAPNSDNEIIVTSEDYSGAIAVLCFKV